MAHDPLAPRPRGEGDAWVDGPDGRFWGLFGAAGLLLFHDDAGLLLQLRAGWSHFGGTWGLPGGARERHETAQQTAVREANEEAGVPDELVEVLGEYVRDVGYWSYTTVIARATERFEPVIGDAESAELAWIPLDEVAERALHPGFAAAWPELRRRVHELSGR